MKIGWDAVAAYAAANAENPRKGYRLGEIPTEDILAWASVEMFELTRAPDDVSEMADLFGCLFHYAQRKGWSIALIERELIRKLALRFPGAPIGRAPEDDRTVNTMAESLAEYDRRMTGKISCSICRDPNCDNPGGKH